MNINTKDYIWGKCNKCGQSILRSEIEKSFELGTHTENHPIIATLPEIHINCGGVVVRYKKILR